nr:MAG TPA: hypothetical protein [Caudoviricetes sp.]
MHLLLYIIIIEINLRKGKNPFFKGFSNSSK